MNLIVACILAGGFSYFLRKPIRKHPGVFYLVALAVDALMMTNAIAGFSPVAARMLFPYLQQSLFAFGILSVVMMVGVLPEGSLKRSLRPIRGELSIIASILIAGHVVHYANPMLTRVFFGGMDATAGTFWGTVLSLVLIALLVVLTVTSFKVVRNAMASVTWKRVQMLAYVFYGLVFCHVFAMLLPSAMGGGAKAVVNVVLYVAILLVYVVGRLGRAYRDRHAENMRFAPDGELAEA
ncbi:hypothetical protein VIN30_01410 [Adlercreutzia sp. R7]|uniref:Ferric oxidoreductase domain-containing protein n=1 Tax=Adlercreutzia wanghongyangiae TaxID=3111451 RepID=A0ABU6IFB3_9ACTN|nr:hypothetical protein [Adlercreutzia sp. R7]